MIEALVCRLKSHERLKGNCQEFDNGNNPDDSDGDSDRWTVGIKRLGIQIFLFR